MSDMSAVSMREVAVGGRISRLVKPWLALVSMFAVFIACDMADGVPYLGDIDDRLRAIQIKQMFGGKGWFDLSISGIAMPEAYISPWSRLVDAPYVAIAWLLSHFMPSEQALSLAHQLWPPVLMLGFAWFSAVALTRLIMPRQAAPSLLHVIAAAFVMFYASLEFDPGRIDHHNVQLLTLSAAFAGVALWSAAGAVLVAFAVALSVTIGLETLPLIAVLWAGLGLAWIFDAPGSGRVFRAFSFSIAVFSPVVTLVFAGPAVLFHVHNDIFSAPYAAAFVGFGAISSVVTGAASKRTSPLLRTALLALPGLVLLAAIVYFAPDILAGPYKIIDPISRRLWLDHVVQEHSIFYMTGGNPLVLLTTVVEAVIAIAAGVSVFRRAKRGEAAPAIIYAVGLAALLATFAALRFIRFPGAALALFVPVLLTEFQTKPVGWQRRIAMLMGGGGLVLALLFYGISRILPVNSGTDKLDAADFLMYDACTKADYAALADMPAGKYMVPSGMALSVLETAPPSIAVSNISYHRSSPGMRRMFETFYMTDAGARQAAMAPFGYLAFCSYDARLQPLVKAPQGSLFAALLAGKAWPGLQPVQVPGAVRLQVLKVDHAAFR